MRVNKIHKSLNEVQNLAGAERGLTICNGTLAAVFIWQLKLFWWIPIAMAIQYFLKWLYKKDPLVRQIYIRYDSQSDRYDPWPRSVDSKNMRPIGLDRGNLC